MSTEYTPTTADIRATYLNRMVQTGAPIEVRTFAATFDRWLAANNAEVAARALQDAIDLVTGGDGYAIRQRLLDRAAAMLDAGFTMAADEIEEEED